MYINYWNLALLKIIHYSKERERLWCQNNDVINEIISTEYKQQQQKISSSIINVCFLFIICAEKKGEKYELNQCCLSLQSDTT